MNNKDELYKEINVDKHDIVCGLEDVNSKSTLDLRWSAADEVVSKKVFDKFNNMELNKHKFIVSRLGDRDIVMKHGV